MNRRYLWILAFSFAGILCGIVGSAGTNASETIKEGVDWQRVDLESRISERLTRALAALLPEKSYIVDVSVRVRSKQLSSASPRIKDLAKQEGAGDNLPLGKLSVDVPSPAVAISSSPPTVFQEIDGVDINIFLDTSVSDVKRTLVTQVVETIVDPIAGEGRADVRIEPVSLLPASEKSPDFLQWWHELQTSLLTLLIAGLMIWALGRGLRVLERLELKKIAALETTKLDSQGAPLSASAGTGAGPTPTRPVQQNRSGQGIENFRALLAEDPEQAAGLVRQWLRASNFEADTALALIPAALRLSEFRPILDRLTPEERRSWSFKIATPATSTAAENADAFVGGEVAEFLLSPALAASDVSELKRAGLQWLSPEDCVAITDDSPTLGAYLVNLLPPSRLSSFFAQLSDESAIALLQTSAERSPTADPSLARTLAQAIERRHKDASGTPFLQHARLLLRNASEGKEGALLSLMAETEQYSALKAAVEDTLPVELVPRLPSQVIRAAVGALDQDRRRELICGQPTERQAWLLEALGPPDSKARAIAESDLARVQADPVLMARYQRRAGAHWMEFIKHLREVTRSTPSFQEAVEEIVEDWLYVKSNGQIGRKMPARPESESLRNVA